LRDVTLQQEISQGFAVHQEVGVEITRGSMAKKLPRWAILRSCREWVRPQG